MRNDGLFYKHSGKFGPLTFVLPVILLPVCLVLAFIYTYAVVYIPLVGYVTFLLTGGFGFLVAMAVMMLIVFAKVRSGLICRLTGLFAGLVAWYLSWAVFIHLMLKRADEPVSFFTIVFKPFGIWGMAKAISVEGWFSIGSGGANVSGIALWICWGLEALIVIGLPLLMAGQAIADKVFCERCGLWSDEKEGVLLRRPTDGIDLVGRMGQKDLGVLAELEQATASDTCVYRVDVTACKSCRDFFTTSVKEIAITINKEGKPEQNVSTVVKDLLISRDDLNRIRTIATSSPGGEETELDNEQIEIEEDTETVPAENA